jgi:hypothetical protein
MGHGTPDWWGTEPTATTHKVSDLGELAARLGSIDTFDRRGDVVWLSGFENGLGEFRVVSGGTGASVVISTTATQRGAYSCKLTAGSSAPFLASISKLVPYPALSKFGTEAAFTWNTGISFLTLEMWLYNGTNYTRFAIKFDQVNSKIYYLNSVGGWTEIGNLPPWTTSNWIFHVAKLVVDLEAGVYARLIVDNTTHLFFSISGEVVASAVQPYLYSLVAMEGPGGTNPSIYVDNLIITQNEP